MKSFSRATPSIARRLLWALLLAYLLVWAAIVGLCYFGLYATGSGEFDRQMSSLAQVMDDVVADETLSLTPALRGISIELTDEGRRVGIDRGYLGFQIHDAAGALLARGGGDAPELKTDDRRAGFFNSDASGLAYRVHRHWSPDHARRIDVTQAISARGQILNVALSSPLAMVQLLAGFPLLLLPMWLAVRSGLAPLHGLTQTLAARPPGNLDPISIPLPYRELTPVVTELNSTLSRLQSLLDRERAFLADAAHELRTPLAVMTAQLDTLKQADSSADSRRAVKRLELGLERSVRLVNQLLALARLDAEVAPRFEAVDLADLARDCLALYSAAAGERGMELSYHGADSLVVPSLGHEFETVMHNLISNSIRFGQTGGHVEVTLNLRAGHECTLEVADDGPGLSPEDRAHVFLRFWRSPSHEQQTTGSGLGLAIVQAAAQRLGGRLRLDDGLNGRGLTVTLMWSAPQDTR